MLGFSEGIISHVSLSYFFLISGNAPLIICFVLRSKNAFTNFTTFLMYYNNFAFKTVAKILLLFLLVLLSQTYHVYSTLKRSEGDSFHFISVCNTGGAFVVI